MVSAINSTTRSPSLFGLETEYAYTAGNREEAGGLFLETAKARLPYVPGSRNDLFLANGSRLYIDCGSHPELATPECTTPWQAVRYCLAGDRIVGEVASNLRNVQGWISKCNVDYSGTNTTWAGHSSFLYRCQFQPLAAQLLPHLASRVVYSGAGGWDPICGGLRFVLSPRSFHLNMAISADRTSELGLINLRNEPLSRSGNRRLHLQCGDSVESQTAIFLAVGTTAVVIALVHAGIEVAKDVALVNPLAAIHTFAGDPTCRATAPTVCGDQLSAVAVQRHYLQLAEKHAKEPFMPRWTAWLCQLWREMLDRLEAGAPWSVADTLDWAIKYALFDRILRRANTDWLRFASKPGLREQLLEADMRFAQVTGTGLFHQLDEAGVLRHRVKGVGDITRAMSVPPSGHRASVRGQLIRELHTARVTAVADWSWICDYTGNKHVDLTDPFSGNAKWQPLSVATTEAQEDMMLTIENTIDAVASLYRRGHYNEADGLLRGMSETWIVNLREWMAARYWRYQAWIQARRGQLGGFTLLDRAPLREHDMQYVYDHLTVARFQGLAVPIALTREWIDRLEAVVGNTDLHQFELGASYLDQKGAYLLRCNRLEEALATYRSSESGLDLHEYIRGRCTAMLAETYRRLNMINEARVALSKACRVHRVNLTDGDLADFTLYVRAKLEPNPARARAWLKRAETIQLELGNCVGLTRTLLLRARLSDDTDEQARLKTQITGLTEQLPAVLDCDVYQRIIREWSIWVADKQAADEHGDRFWGL